MQWRLLRYGMQLNDLQKKVVMRQLLSIQADLPQAYKFLGRDWRMLKAPPLKSQFLHFSVLPFGCCVIRLAFGCCTHPKAGQNIFSAIFQPFCSFHSFFGDFTAEMNKKLCLGPACVILPSVQCCHPKIINKK